METPHVGSGNRICTVVFVDIVQYSEQVVSQQVQMKSRFSALVGDTLEHTPVADRLVVDTGDGAALCFLGAPEDALFAANSLRSRVLEAPEPHGLRLRLGINLGPVRVVKDINGRTNVIGDGINVAQRVMSFAEPNQILVSRSYYEVVSRLSRNTASCSSTPGCTATSTCGSTRCTRSSSPRGRICAQRWNWWTAGPHPRGRQSDR
jgi:class 3 adenylate cyclase